jgi:hypothetical protein
MQEVIIHIGLPKTASTSLQIKYLNNHKDLFFIGSILKAVKQSETVRRFFLETNCFPSSVTPEILLDKYFYSSLVYKRDLEEILYSGFDESFTTSFYDNYVQKRLGAGRKVIVSNEGFSVGTFVPVSETAERLHLAFPKAKIFFIIRNPINWIKSRYLQAFRGVPSKIPEMPSFSEWLWYNYKKRDCTQSIYHDLRWGSLLKHYSSLFGKENIKVLVFEQFIQSRNLFMAELSDFIGIDLENTIDKKIKDHFNSTLTRGDILFKNKYFSKCSFLSNRYSIGFVNRILGSKINLKMESDIAKKTLEYIKPELSELINVWGLPLKDFGYPIV